MRMRKCIVLALGLMSAAPAFAEQRFYQVMDAQGRIQTVIMPDEPEPAKNKPEQAEKSVETTKPDSPVTPADVPARPASVESAAPEAEASTDDSIGSLESREYMDSEELERSNFNPEKKKRFYLLNDGIGNRIEESGEAEGGNQPDARPMFMPPEETPEYFKVFQAAPVDVQAPEALLSLFAGMIRKSPDGKPLCLGKASRRNVQALSKEVSASVVIDSKTRYFLGNSGVVSVFSVAGEGLRAIRIRSISNSDRKPAFIEPVIAYANEAGCVIRATTNGYFEHWLPATNSRHPLLEGRLTMLTGERFLLVVLPGGRTTPSTSDFPSSTDGVLAVKWHE